MFARLTAAVLMLAGATDAAFAQAPISYRGKSLTMIIGSAPGGGTDTSGRLIAQFIARYLPDTPSVLIRNIPGAEGMTAVNYFVQQVAPDGYTIVMGSSTLADPMHYRRPQSHFDPTTFPILGGVGRGGTMLMIGKDAEKRLYDKSQPPVIMGSLVGVPRSGMQTTAWGIEFLGWNAKWVVGYHGTNDLMLALDRTEIDMTSTANLFEVNKLAQTGRFKPLTQTGGLQNGKIVPRPEFVTTPLLSNIMAGKIADPVQRKAFDFWSSMTVMDKWMALPPKTPQPIVDMFREAFQKVAANTEFIEAGRKISEDFSPMRAEDVEQLIRTLGQTPPEAIGYISNLLRSQGLEVE